MRANPPRPRRVFMQQRLDDACPDHRGGESHAARFGGAHPASESCDGVAGESALRWRSFGFVLG